MSLLGSLVLSLLGLALLLGFSDGQFHSKRLHDDVFSDYNRLIRPSKNHSYKLVINIGLKLTQIIDINMKQQVMTTNLWLEQNWYDYKLTWNPAEYGGVDQINVPAESIWLPDIVLFNNADGNYEVTLMTKATVYYTGLVVWNPPALFKSTCKIDVEYFPFDIQSCLMKFGSWTYDGNEVDMRHVKQVEDSNMVEMAIDISDYYKSVEWDILLAPAQYNEEYFDCCKEPYPDITFNLTMRRKTLFYTVNLIIPCVGISFLTVLVFYLPSDSGEKVTLSISILVAVTVFFLLLTEIIPPTSLAVPLIGKYLLFTMVLVTLSIGVTVGVLNVHFRSPSTHVMTPFVRKVFLHILPRLLCITRPTSKEWHGELAAIGRRNRFKTKSQRANGWDNSYRVIQNRVRPEASLYRSDSLESCHDDDCTAGSELDASYAGPPNGSCDFAADEPIPASPERVYTANQIALMNTYYEQNCAHLREIFHRPDVSKAIKGIIHMAEHIKKDDEDNNIIEDWKFIAMLLDRLFLWIFTLAVFGGTICIILQAPSLYDQRNPLDTHTAQHN